MNELVEGIKEATPVVGGLAFVGSLLVGSFFLKVRKCCSVVENKKGDESDDNFTCLQGVGSWLFHEPNHSQTDIML